MHKATEVIVPFPAIFSDRCQAATLCEYGNLSDGEIYHSNRTLLIIVFLAAKHLRLLYDPTPGTITISKIKSVYATQFTPYPRDHPSILALGDLDGSRCYHKLISILREAQSV